MTTTQTLRLGIYGSGRTATELVRALLPSRHRLVAGIVHSPERSGVDFGTQTLGDPIGLLATADVETAVRVDDIDLLLYAGLSGECHQRVMALCADAGVDMVHACFVHPRTALERTVHDRIAERSMQTGSRIVGTGMIPGLWLDVLPALLSSGLPAPVSVRATRQSDISSWGSDVLRNELGVGTEQIGIAEQADRVLRESAHMIGEALGLGRVACVSRGGLVAASEDIHVGEIAVARGQVAGFDQEVVVSHDDVERVALAWSGSAGFRSDREDTDKQVELELIGGDGTRIVVGVTTPADPYPGTAARMLQAAGALGRLPPGLHPTSALPIAW